jgi:hypothetical protein
MLATIAVSVAVIFGSRHFFTIAPSVTVERLPCIVLKSPPRWGSHSLEACKGNFLSAKESYGWFDDIPEEGPHEAELVQLFST